MKIRNPLVIRWIGFLGACLIRLWMGTLAYRYRPLGRRVSPEMDDFRGNYIFAFWHENILLPCYQYAHCGIAVLISEHSDGEMIAQVCRHIGYDTIRGSITRGGTKALRKMIRWIEHGQIAVMPDGPRGPRRHVELGLIYLASRTQAPLVLVGVGYDRPWRLPTWDRFALPRPWSKAVVVTMDPIMIPESADKKQLEEYRLQVEKTLVEVSDYAEKLASM